MKLTIESTDIPFVSAGRQFLFSLMRLIEIRTPDVKRKEESGTLEGKKKRKKLEEKRASQTE